MDDWFVVNNAQNWIRGVIYQGNRVLTLDEEMKPPDNPDDFFKWTKQSRSKQFLRPIEEHFFVVAVNKAIEWLLEAEKLSLIKRGVSKTFRKTANLGIQVRNMREHDLAYFQGRGQKQHAFETAVTINGVEGAGIADASSTMVTDEGYLIGGRVNVQKVTTEAQQLSQKIDSALTDIESNLI